MTLVLLLNMNCLLVCIIGGGAGGEAVDKTVVHTVL